MKIEVGKLYKYVEDFGDKDAYGNSAEIFYYFVTKVNKKSVTFYSITNPDYSEMDSLEWAIDYWREVC